MKELKINDRTVLQPVSDGAADIIQDDGTEIPERIRLRREDAQTLRDALGQWLCENSPADDDNKVAVLVAEGVVPVVIFAISEAAWEYCKDGKTHNFDLSTLDLPLHVHIVGGPTKGFILDEIERGQKAHGGTLDRANEHKDLTPQEQTKQ